VALPVEDGIKELLHATLVEKLSLADFGTTNFIISE
jgi:hypothetical protein